ncbi:MAG: FAD-dependent oxidoreductase [bacterium]|nr:FAD-dependent oxidoreductase [bacterium]MDZ4247914.1 FAD-dependent oxidoreductase [Patescibacteria group bacterium]
MKPKIIQGFSIPLKARREVAEGTFELTFDFTGRPLDFVAGQYLSLIAPPELDLDSPADQRDFSIASSPREPEAVSIAFRDSDSLVKRWLRGLASGTDVTFHGPAGSFMLPDDDAKSAALAPVAMVAGGIGVTPFRAMLSDPQQRDCRIGLFCWNRRTGLVPFADELPELTSGDRRSFVNEIGSFDPVPLKAWHAQYPDSYWYVAGPSEMVWGVLAALEKLDVSKKRVRTEEFTGYEDRSEL